MLRSEVFAKMGKLAGNCAYVMYNKVCEEPLLTLGTALTKLGVTYHFRLSLRQHKYILAWKLEMDLGNLMWSLMSEFSVPGRLWQEDGHGFKICLGYIGKQPLKTSITK